MGSGVSAMMEQSAVISGIGKSACGRNLDRDPWELTLDAALEAIADAGLEVDAIDGVSTYPGGMGSTPGITGAGADDVRSLLGLKTRWHNGGAEMPGQLGSIINAFMAVHAGLAEHVLCFRTVWEATAAKQAGSRAAQVRDSRARERTQWWDPYGFGYPSFGAMAMQRYMHESGATREQLAQIALTARAHAALNPAAVYRNPLSLDEYLGGRMISDPLCLFDCDVPIDGSVAFIVSRADSTAIDARRAIRVAAVGSKPGLEESAEMMWSRTDLRPADVGMAQLYDGFSILALRWMEALRLCPRNEGGRFIEGGSRIALSGELPLNTGGGQLSGGRTHGYGALHEACVQLRGEAGERQIAARPSVGVVSSGAEAFTSCLLLTR
jgi:acetyl-CoA acetyltransferase